MKKRILIILINVLILFQPFPVIGKGEESNEIFLEKVEYTINDQVIINLDLNENIDINSIDSNKSRVFLENGDVKKEFHSLYIEDSKCFFQFSVDESFGIEKVWNITKVDLYNKMGEKIDFNLDNEKVDFLVTDISKKNQVDNYENDISIQEERLNISYELAEVQDLKVTNYDGGYKVTGYKSGSTVKVHLATWTSSGGQDDLIWEEASVLGDTFEHKINMKDHNAEVGEYVTHVYAYDINGNYTFSEVRTNVTPSNAKTRDLNIFQGDGEYTVKGQLSESVEKVHLATWTSHEGQDDLIWEEAALIGDNFSHTIDMDDHNNEKGEYVTHVYTYDHEGNYTCYELKTDLNILPASIYNLEVIQNDGFYSITGNISKSVEKVHFATWTSENGQDDLIWESGTIEGDCVSHIVRMNDHNNEIGNYITHVYAYDSDGEYTKIELSSVMTHIVPDMENIEIEKNDGGYIIKGKINNKVKRIEYATWTSSNGQDDLIWEFGTVDESIISHAILMRNHNDEHGEYITHVYLYDENNNYTKKEIRTSIQDTVPIIDNIKVEKDDGGYKITGIPNGKASSIHIATWTTSNNQDDLLWEVEDVESNEFNHLINIRDHFGEVGEYVTHIYVYDLEGNFTKYEFITSVGYVNPIIENVEVDSKDGQYIITGEVSGNVSEIHLATWTSANGQDDLIWVVDEISDNNFRKIIDVKDHDYEIGEYISHIYAYDLQGNFVLYEVKINVSTQKPILTSLNVTGGNGTYAISGVVSANVTKVHIATWTQVNGQDDLIWEEGTISNGKLSYTIDIMNHNYEVGDYLSHVYVYDAAGNYTVREISKRVVNNAPVIDNVQVSNITTQGYMITCTVSDDYKLDKVLFPTWTSANGQDDIIWGSGTINGNSVSYEVKVSDHNFAFGEYISRVYAYDAAGNYSIYEIPSVFVKQTSLTAGWSIINGNKYLYDANGNLVNGAKYLVIDVSEHNGDIDWNSVRNSGVDAVILRSSYGFDFVNGFSSSQMDDKFRRNVSELNRLGIPYGIYHFSYAKNIGEGALEAKYMLECMKSAGAKPTLPLYYDLESSNYVGDKSSSFYTSIIHEFADVVEGAGYTVGVYANYNWWTTKLKDSTLNKYTKWVAHYGSNNNNLAGTANPNWHPGNEYMMWQYSSCGSVSGISTRVDMNALYDRH